MDKVKEFLDIFKTRFKNEKRFRYVTVGAALTLTFILLVQFIGENEKKKSDNSSEHKITQYNTQNEDASFQLGTTSQQRVADAKAEEKLKSEAIANDTSYIQTKKEERHDKVNNKDGFITDENNSSQNDSIGNFLNNMNKEDERIKEEEERDRKKRALGLSENYDKSSGIDSDDELVKERINAKIAQMNAIYTLSAELTGTSSGFVSNRVLDSNDINILYQDILAEKEAENDNNAKYAKDFKIIPGSSFFGELMSPINSNYPEVKPIIKFTSGDLAGYIGVGDATLKSLGSGLVININKVTDPSGNSYSVNGVAFNDKTGNPGFRDEINNYLFQRVGYGLLGDTIELAGNIGAERYNNKNEPVITGLNPNAINNNNVPITPICIKYQATPTGQVCIEFSTPTSPVNERVQINNSTTYKNSTKEAIVAGVKAKAISKTGTILGGVFNELANSYKSEVLVNPQKVIVVFY